MIITAPVGLDAAQRSTLERLVIRARALLESDLAAQAEGRFGIHLDGTIEDDAALPDETTDKITRRDLEQIVAHLRTLGEDAPGAVARLLREAAFTHLNRLVAIRIAEAIGLLPESLAAGPQSRGFKDLGEIMPMLAGDYRSYVRLCGDELAADAPALFDPRNPLLALQPSTVAFDELVGFVADPEATEIWLAPDTLGWAYQFFNTGDERREMREASAPRNSRELAVRNQFFTPRYVVDFLVQNTIGRRLIENDPASSLLDELPLLVDPPTEPGPSLKLEEVKCLDPACGSGHFLLGCYDVLERAWELAGVPPSESAPKIVASLWGVDIDARCAQVASAAIVLRARRHCRDLALPRPNIVTARGLPGGSAELPPGLQLTSGQRSLIDRVSEVLADAPLLGTLLKAEEALGEEIRHGVFGGKLLGRKPGMLELTAEAAEATELELLGHLQAIADRASSSVVERLLAAEADDALRLVEVVRQRYDAVLMNPPFGAPVPETKPYLARAYPWISTRTHDMFCAFVGRGLELCKSDGYTGAITTRSGLFLSSFEEWREKVFLEHRAMVVADLGHGVMEQALVEAAAYVIGADRAPPLHRIVFIRLLKDKDRPAALLDVLVALSAGRHDNRVFRQGVDAFRRVPGKRLSYWFDSQLRDLFGKMPPVETGGVLVRRGVQTGDDFRFIRTAWEVSPGHVSCTRDGTQRGGRWVPLAKGGEYAPYWADLHLLVDWEFDGRLLRSYEGAIVPSPQHYFSTGLSWPRRTASGFGVRLMQSGAIFSDKGPAVIALDPHVALLLLAWLNSRIAQACIDTMVAAGEEVSSGGASRSYETGIVQLLPNPLSALSSEASAEVERLVTRVCRIFASWDQHSEVARQFVEPGVVTMLRSHEGLAALASSSVERYEDDVVEILALTRRIEELLADELALGEETRRFLDDEVGPHPRSYSAKDLSDDPLFFRFYAAPTENLIDEVVALRGGARYLANLNFFADRRIEVLCHALEADPASVIEARRASGLLPPGQLRSVATELFSYLVGVACGRWDVRAGRDRSLEPLPLDLFDPVPICPPGMLVGVDGLPTATTPAGYPLDLPPARLIVDEPGQTWDIEAMLIRAAGVLFDDSASVVAEMLQILGRRTIRDHLRKQFFKDHLSLYSKSRRKAPIYWPLTVPSKNWGVWVYAPTLTRETLYAVASEAGRRERLASAAIVRLQREQDEGGAGRPARKVAEELEVEEKLAVELGQFRAEAERVAGLGWEPDLDDGIVLCAAPLADLFPSWRDAKTARAELRKGKYGWATVAAWADQL
jgi:hypothetical protein